MSVAAADSELKGRHRKMWASGDYPSMVETFLLPLGPRLVEACGIEAGRHACWTWRPGTGNAAIRRRRARRDGDRQRPDARAARGRARDGRGRRARARLGRGRRGEPAVRGRVLRRRDVVDRRDVRAPPPGRRRRAGARLPPRRHDRPAELDARRACSGALFRTIGPFAPPPPPGAQPPPLWGSEEHLRGLFGGRVDWTTLERDVLEITAFEHPRDYGEHFKASTARRSPPGRTRRRTAARASSTRRWTRSATSGTAARRSRRGSRRSTWSRWERRVRPQPPARDRAWPPTAGRPRRRPRSTGRAATAPPRPGRPRRRA